MGSELFVLLDHFRVAGRRRQDDVSVADRLQPHHDAREILSLVRGLALWSRDFDGAGNRCREHSRALRREHTKTDKQAKDHSDCRGDPLWRYTWYEAEWLQSWPAHSAPGDRRN